MGYETTLIFIRNWDTIKTGYHHVEASLEMGKITYNAISELNIKAHKDEKSEAKLQKEIWAYKNKEKCVYDFEWNSCNKEYTEEMNLLSAEKREVEVKKLMKMKMKLEKKLPYIFWSDGNHESFTDDYGDLLLIVSLTDLKLAILNDMAKDIIEQKWIYPKYTLALKMIEAFESDGNDVKVILWGH